MKTPTERQKQRAEYLATLLSCCHLTLDDLAEPTRKALDDYARFVLTSGDAPSANWNAPIVDLCRAVEFELASLFAMTKLHQLMNLSDDTVGQIGKFLASMSGDQKLKSQLEHLRIKPGQLLIAVPQHLRSLARLRTDTGSAHGGSTPREATKGDADKATDLVVGPNMLFPLLNGMKKSLRSGEPV